ncbi:MAG: CopD family protein [Chloroflexi bacterium]|nr:CopD family protein [Chloroflexota bacterium]
MNRRNEQSMSAKALTQPRIANGMLDRYVLPKVALATISIASLAGVYMTMTMHGATAALAVVRWLHLVGLGVLAGGTMWWGWFVRPPEQVADRSTVAQFALAQQGRFRALSAVALAAVTATAPSLLWFAIWANEATTRVLWFGNAAALLAAVVAVSWLLSRPLTEERAFARGFVRLVWATLVVAIALTAVLDARLTFPAQPLAWILRPIHVIAFSLWIGGAVWNIFVEVPGAQATLAFPVVIAASQQLERFRWAVRAILPTLVVTGLLQAYAYIGLDLSLLFTSFFGQLILLKLGLVVTLVGIFITCPMWRACSPIKGMCDLDDLSAPKLPAPARRLDNRGKGCAGFVKIQKLLQGIEAGQVVELLSSDRISWWELPPWVEKHGHRLLKKEKNGRWLWQWYRFMIQKGEAESAKN